MYNRTDPAAREPDNDSYKRQTEPATPQPTPARRNPRYVVGSLDYFEMLMEQEEQA